MKRKAYPIRLKQVEAVLAVAALFLVPFVLSRKSRVLRRILIWGRPPEIFPYLNDLHNWPKWTNWGRREKVEYTYFGPDEGVGAGQKWRTRRMHGETTILQSVSGEQVMYHADINDGRFLTDGILTLEPLGDVTRVTWLCRWDSGPNPYARYKSLLMKPFVGHDFKAGLSYLKELIESS